MPTWLPINKRRFFSSSFVEPLTKGNKEHWKHSVLLSCDSHVTVIGKTESLEAKFTPRWVEINCLFDILNNEETKKKDELITFNRFEMSFPFSKSQKIRGLKTEWPSETVGTDAQPFDLNPKRAPLLVPIVNLSFNLDFEISNWRRLKATLWRMIQPSGREKSKTVRSSVRTSRQGQGSGVGRLPHWGSKWDAPGRGWKL